MFIMTTIIAPPVKRSSHNIENQAPQGDRDAMTARNLARYGLFSSV
jgi:hypothetical protein